MFWQAWSERLKKEFGLTTEPVAIAFTGKPTADAADHGKVSVCQALRRAGQGESFVISVETCGCPGGLVNLGLGQMSANGHEKLVQFLVDKEKVYCSRLALHRGQQSVTPPVSVASHVVFAPLGKTTVQPDLVAFIGAPGRLYSLFGLVNYWEGGSILAEMAGPACRTGVSYPAVTGQIGVSLLDSGARRLAGFDEDQMLVTVPLHRMLGVMLALEQGAGGRRDKEAHDVEREIDSLGRVEAVK